MARTAVLGLPRMGANREVKFALESFWAGDSSIDDLQAVAVSQRRQGWLRARAAGVDVIPSGDFSLYDHVLDTIWALGAIPARFGELDRSSIADYFVLARGDDSHRPLEMTKWFDTNYHYLVPELAADQVFDVRADHWTGPLAEAHALGVDTRPVILGPFSFLKLSKGLGEPLALIDRLVAAYRALLEELASAGASEVQLDEPCLVLDLADDEIEAAAGAIASLVAASPLRISLATYFDGLHSNGTLARVIDAAPWELQLDLVRAPDQLTPALELLRERQTRLSLGVVDGRNIWATDPDRALERIDLAIDALGSERVTIASSCSLLHLPHSTEGEHGIDPEVRPWIAFSHERLAELGLLGAAASADKERRNSLLSEQRAAVQSRRQSPLTNNHEVRARAAAVTPADYGRSQSAPERRIAQHARVPLPELPTTTIGSFPQTPEIRAIRRAFRAGEIGQERYVAEIEEEIRRVVEFQERLGFDLLVHGEPERNDMVEYFGEQLAGFAFSLNGWVQSYGSRCVKPPILYGDVWRAAPITVEWWQSAQALTDRPMKGMLTGPVTILEWSFVRDDQPKRETCLQVALAIQDEVIDLESAGCFAIQVDEAALREGQPLQQAAQEDYNRWAIDCFRLTVAPARPDTQIHTHMCYSEFNDMIDHIIRLDADVISIEASRSDMEVLEAFTGEREYPNDIGPGVYDIHSPRVPTTDEIERLLELAEQRIGRERLWVNPDCGLKTRGWTEVEPALENLIAATERRRAVVSAVS